MATREMPAGVLWEVSLCSRKGHTMQLDPAETKAVLNRLKRAQGQLGGVIKMLEEGRDCQEVVTQIAAVARAIDRAGYQTIAIGMRQCLLDPENNTMDPTAMEKLFLSLA